MQKTQSKSRRFPSVGTWYVEWEGGHYYIQIAFEKRKKPLSSFYYIVEGNFDMFEWEDFKNVQYLHNKKF